MIKIIINKYKKYKEIINYIIFGGLTTLVNIIVYFIFAKIFNIDELFSNVVAWILSVLFAYITNKLFVFESKTRNIKSIIGEILSFFGCRLLSGGIDIGLFALMIKVLSINDGISKIVTQILIIIINYVFSKLIVFRNGEEKNEKN